jgi:hypothetical protein
MRLLGPDAEPRPEDWDWLSTHRAAAFESLMPVKPQPQTWVTYFSYRDLYQDVHEAYFSIRGDAAGAAPEAVIVRPLERSIQQQLLELHMADRAMPFQAALAQVKVRRQVLSSQQCRGVMGALDSLRQLRFTMPERELIVLHPTVHRIIVQFGGGDLDLSLTEDEHPLAVWATRTLAELRSCGAGE